MQQLLIWVYMSLFLGGGREGEMGGAVGGYFGRIDNVSLHPQITVLQSMINRNYAEDARICERIKFDQALYILTMYEKKIRKNKNKIGSNGIVDADLEMQDIIASWKSKWKMDLTKPILNCVTSVYPRILIDPNKQDSPQTDQYYRILNQFLIRLRTEHEDESNFKMVMQVFDRQVEYLSNDKYQTASKATLKGFLLMARQVSDQMLQKVLQNYQNVSNSMMEVNTENIEWQVIGPLRYVREIARRALTGDQETEMQAENDIQPKCRAAEALIAFSSNVVRMMERIKQSQHGSTLITIQPKAEELSLLIHPLLIAVGANFKKENHEKTKDYEWGKIQVDSIPMMQTPKSSYNYSKVVFLNLDGYQSEFNLQFVRNFKKHLLYITFPKEDAKLDNVKQIFSHRFFKKLMFKYTQSLFQTFSDQFMSEDYRALTLQERLSFNPEEYHTIIQKLYEHKNDKSTDDFNTNIYPFPIRLSILSEKFKQLMEGREDIENHQSYFVRFVIKDFLLNQIREFNPTLILISYSGRIHIEDHHFVQIMQELTKIANYKLLFYPNLTTSFVSKEQAETEDLEGEACEYDNHIDDVRIKAPLALQEGTVVSEHWFELFNKISRFLKVSSGTYNLNRSFEEQPLISKYKNQYILRYVDELMAVMGKQYPSIDKIRFKNKDLSILPKLFEENIKNIKKTFEHTVPKLYFDIYDIIEYLLLERPNRLVLKREELLKEYRLVPEDYQELLDRLRDDILGKSSYQTTVVNIQSMSEQLQKEKCKKMKEVFSSLKESHLFEISSQKFEQKVNIYFKTLPENKEYPSVQEETESIRGVFETTFYAGKANLKIYDSTKVIYKVDQINRRSQKIPVMVLNNLTDGTSENCFESYMGELDIGNTQGADKKAFEEKKCQVSPITFEKDVDKDSKLFLLSEWNFHQTEDYLLLFWPSKYDFLQSFLLKLMNKPYRPPILNEVYFWRKGEKGLFFKRALIDSPHPIAARMGTSCYHTHGKLYIFGGFYPGQKNYLQLQHDIVTMDLQTFQQGGEQKLGMQNIKSRLYSRQSFDSKIQRREQPNSFVRPRMQFQFFEGDQLMPEGVMEEENTKRVIMLGGYGQNFMRPYSLLTYYYYLLRFSPQERTLSSITKKLIYNKAIPINIREMTKNTGVIRTNKKTKGSMLQTGKLVDPDAYTLYRNSFKIEMKEGEQDFNYKVKYMFSEDEYKNFKHQIKKIQELRAEEFDSSSISVERDPANNHIITIEKDGKKKMVKLRMEIPQDRDRKIEGEPREVNLTHESIVCLDIYTTMICAIVRHEKYTQGRSILVEYNTKCLQGLNFQQDLIQYIPLSWVKEFDCDLTLHILIICNKNTVAILHGQKLTGTTKPKQFIVKRKKTKNEIGCYQIKERDMILRRNQVSSLINTVFFRHRNKIMSVDFISIDDSYQFYISCQEIELNSPNDQYRWTTSNLDRFDPTFQYEICFSHKNFVRLGQLKFVDFLKNNNENYLLVQYNRKKYICEVSRYTKVLQLLEEGTLKIEMESMEKGILLNKTEDKYHDRELY